MIFISISGVILLAVWVIVRINLVIMVGLDIGNIIFYMVLNLVVFSVSEFLCNDFGICVSFFFVVMIIIGSVRIVNVIDVYIKFGVLNIGVGVVLG